MKFISFILEKKIIGLLILIALIVHLALGKSRWQYYPLYFLIIIYFSLVSLNYFDLLNLKAGMAKWIIAIGIFSILITMFFVLALPMEKLPIPSGEFEIATKIYDLEDKSRNEIYTELENHKRKIKYQVWYPAEKTVGYKQAKWITEGRILTRQLAKSMGLPGFILDHTAKIYSNSYYNAPINNTLEKYPIVIISHGWKGFRELHTDFAEELASNGFIAISIDHTYGAQAVRFKDGEIAYLNKEALPSGVQPPKFNQASRKLVTSFGEDVGSVLDDLERLNRGDKDLKGKLNLESIGLLGHSTGGGGHVYISLRDNRVKALLGLDAWVEPLRKEDFKEGLTIPLLFLSSEQWSKGPNNNSLKTLLENSDHGSLIQLNKTNHVDFSMTYMYSPLTKYVSYTGELGGRKSSEIQRKYILEFFNKNLK